MSRLSISNSETPAETASQVRAWRRVRRGILWLMLVLLIVEVVLRLPPLEAWLQTNLASYENLLWYDDIMPGYAADVRQNGPYDIWLTGSSYMMTGLNPALIEQNLALDGISLTVQNFGMNRMINLVTMQQVFDRWLLNAGQPEIVVLGLSSRNFIAFAADDAPIQVSPYESAFIFPDNLGDHVAAQLYQHSRVYRYGILLRNATFIPQWRTNRPVGGGFVARPQQMDCSPHYFEENLPPEKLALDMSSGLQRLDILLNSFSAREIAVLVVSIPAPECTINHFYTDYDSYVTNYLTPVREYLAARGLTFVALEERFRAVIAPDAQPAYFYDAFHPNTQGAQVFSTWTADALAEWLEGFYAG